MASDQRSSYRIAIVTTSEADRAFAIAELENIYQQPITPLSDAYVVGRIGKHNVVVASVSDPASTPALIDSLLKDFPHIRAGFLVTAEGSVSHNGIARIGDVVVGVKPEARHGLVHFGKDSSMGENQIVMTGQLSLPPRTVIGAISDMASPRAQCTWHRHLGFKQPTAEKSSSSEHGRPLKMRLHQQTAPPRALRGTIGSLNREAHDTSLVEKTAKEYDTMCFTTAARNLQAFLPFLAICGVSDHYNQGEAVVTGSNVVNLPGRAAFSYASGLLHQLDPEKLDAEDRIANIFRYPKFDLERPGFRLLKLEPEKKQGVFRGTLFQAYMDEPENIIEYHALSYAWGCTELTERIMVDGHYLPITDNLEHALDNLREPGKARILWIDAICIDQSNFKERGHQVGVMNQIFAKAANVIFWLGRGNFDTQALMSSLQKFQSKVYSMPFKTWHVNDSHWKDIWNETQPSNHEEILTLRKKQHDGLIFLLEKPWFQRVWIVQEVFNARRATIGCNRGLVKADVFSLAPMLLEIEPHAHCQAIIESMPGPYRNSRLAEKPTLVSLLWKFRGQEATDNRDKIYALLDLARHTPEKPSLEVSYGKSEVELLQDTMTYMFGETKVHVPTITYLQENLAKIAGDLLTDKIRIAASPGYVKDYIQECDLFISEDAILAAVQRGPDMLRLILGSKVERIPIQTELICKAAQMNQYSFNPALADSSLPVFLETEYAAKEVQFSHSLFNIAARYSASLVHYFLKNYGNEFVITREILEEAAQGTGQALEVLLDGQERETDISKSVIQQAVGNKTGPNSFRVVFKKCGSNFEISNDILLEAFNGRRTIDPLLHACENKPRITEQIIIAAIIHHNARIEKLNTLLTKGPQRQEYILDNDSQSFQVSNTESPLNREIFQFSNEFEIPYAAFSISDDYLGEDYKLKEKAADSAYALESLLAYSSREIKITQRIFKSAQRFKSKSRIMDSMQILLQKAESLEQEGYDEQESVRAEEIRQYIAKRATCKAYDEEFPVETFVGDVQNTVALSGGC
ncbi:hypothetical protein CDD81_233 [Ophiocordyceps australis]|uniref:Heterokaryon incompatibility domain-containing protein n=1 Tax=Ophiocordyceps australis TaxID=1399860 RepID=A0A2C5YFB1_9HYPO|nr:hypothetical protein CDD81_233 [Ophiocordyceps australis]